MTPISYTYIPSHRVISTTHITKPIPWMTPILSRSSPCYHRLRCYLAKKSFLHLCDVLFRPLVDVFHRNYTPRPAGVLNLLPTCDLLMTSSRILPGCRSRVIQFWLGEDVVDDLNLVNFLNPHLTISRRSHGGLGASKHCQLVFCWMLERD